MASLKTTFLLYGWLHWGNSHCRQPKEMQGHYDGLVLYAQKERGDRRSTTTF